MGIRLCLGWETGEFEQLRCDTPFALRGRKALLLGFVRLPEEGCRLWFMHEESRQPCPDVEPFKGTVRRDVMGRYMAFFQSMLTSISLQGESVYMRSGEAGTLSECAGVKPDLVEYLMHRGKTYGGFGAATARDVVLGLYTVRQDLDFAALAGAGDLRFSLVFEDNAAQPRRLFVNTMFAVPLAVDWQGEARGGYEDPAGGGAASVIVRRVRAFDAASIAGLRDIIAYLGFEAGSPKARDVVAGVTAAAAGGDRLVFAEYVCDSGRTVSLYLDSFLSRPRNEAARIVIDINDRLERTGGGKACLGFHRGDLAGDGKVEILCCNYYIPEEVVEVVARGVVAPDPDVERFRDAADTHTARDIMEQIKRLGKR